MKMKLKKMIAGIIIVSAFFGLSLNGQDRNDVIQVYNEGAKAIQTDVPAAIAAFEKVVDLCAQVGESADDLKQKAEGVLPGLYYKLAATAYNDKKPAGEIIQAAKDAIAAADKYQNDKYKDNAAKILVQGYYRMATDFFSANDYENALQAFDSVLVLNPDNIASIYNKALIYKSQDSADAFEETIDLFLSKLEEGTDDDKAETAKGVALEYFRSAGSKLIQEEKLDEALVSLEKAEKYGDDKTLFYFLADVHNKKNDFALGEEYAQKGLDLETGDAEAKAMFYYQLAVAQAGKGNTAAACESFKNAQYGPFEEASKAQRTNLKCN
jgi:tetratricopeptide (TPR) repeat protein